MFHKNECTKCCSNCCCCNVRKNKCEFCKSSLDDCKCASELKKWFVYQVIVMLIIVLFIELLIRLGVL